MRFQHKALCAFLLQQFLDGMNDENDITAYASLVQDFLTHEIQESERRSQNWKKVKKKNMMKWSEWSSKCINDRNFRRYFRMPRGCFESLCKDIEMNVGSETFKSERFIQGLEEGTHGTSSQRKMHMAKKANGNGFLSGEIKLAVCLRMLAGGSYLDLSLIFDVSTTQPYDILHEVVGNWICKDFIADFSSKKYLSNERRLASVAKGFADRSRNIFTGCIGALDGWLVKIKKPSIQKDKIQEPGDFFCRKGFFSVNVQVIVDRDKRIIYRSIKSRGAEHDSTAFKNSDFYKEMRKREDILKEQGFYIITDSAYPVRATILCPYSNALHQDTEDNFNYYHSSSRIVVECTFGEVDMRWGILWKPLRFSLENNIGIIDACLRLHNYIVTYRLQYPSGHDDGITLRNELDIFDDDLDFTRASTSDSGGVDGVHHGADELDRRLLTYDDKQSYEDGKRLRSEICSEIHDRKLKRPRVNWYQHRDRVLEK